MIDKTIAPEELFELRKNRIPVVTQEKKSGRILGLNLTDKSAFDKTLETGECHYYDDVNDMKEYQIAGQFYKSTMIVFDAFPFAIGDLAIEEIQELLSKKTRDFCKNIAQLWLSRHKANREKAFLWTSALWMRWKRR